MISRNKTKYKNEYIVLLQEHLSSGYSFQSFAGIVKVGSLTLYNWVKRYPEFKAVKDKYPYVQPRIYAPCFSCNRSNVV
jgi:transposase